MALPQNILQQVITYQRSGLAYLLNSCCFVSTANTKFKDFDKIEANIALNAISGVPLDPKNGATSDPSSGPFRFFGDGKTPISSYGTLAQMLANFRDFGAAYDSTKVYLPMVSVPAIVNSELNQFVLKRNEEIANSWWLGDFAEASFYQSNLLPIHQAGTVGDSDPEKVLTVVSTNDPTGKNITQITFSGAEKDDKNAMKAGDLFQFQDNVEGKPNLRYLTFIGHTQSAQPVQCRVTADASADESGNVTVNIAPVLVATPNSANQNISQNIVAGMQIKVMPSHRAGLVVGGNALFLAMPRLPEETPFPTAADHDPDTGVSLRYYYGSLFGQNQRGFVHDCIWGSTVVPEYSMRICFPL